MAPAISGFFRSIALGGTAPQKGKGGPLQDILRLLTLWFNHGAAPEVEAALVEGGVSGSSIPVYRSPRSCTVIAPRL